MVDDGTTGKMIIAYQITQHDMFILEYGKHLVLLDATYNATKYALRLYFLVIQTNVNYQVRWR